MGCDVEYVDPLDPTPKASERMREHSTPKNYPPKNRTSHACPSSQECVGQKDNFTNLMGPAPAKPNGGGRQLTRVNRTWSSAWWSLRHCEVREVRVIRFQAVRVNDERDEAFSP